EVLRKNEKPLKKIIDLPKPEDDEHYKILDLIIQYAEKFKQLPPNKNALRDFAKTSEEHDLRMGWSETLVQTLKGLNDIDETRLKSITDINILVDSVIKEAEKDYYRFLGKHFIGIVNAGPTKQEGKFKDPSGTKDAKAMILKGLMDNVYAVTEIESGWMHEHIDSVAGSLDDKLAIENTETRMKVLMPHIDKAIIIGPQNLRYIGIAGMSGDGKTTILNTIVYNWLKQGFNGLYVSFEHSPLEVWEFMAFLHSSHEDYADMPPLPSLADWDLAKDPESGINVAQEDVQHMATILRDIKERRNVTGKLDVQDGAVLSTFEAIVAHLETNEEEGNYHFIVVDYLARMNVPGDARYRDVEIKNIIHKSQFLTRSYNNGRGVVFVTPMQVNREANKAAKKVASNEAKDGQGESTFYDLNAIANFSEYQHDMDYIFSVYSDEKMKADNRLIMETLKIRKGKRPPLALLEIQPGAGRVVEKLEGAATPKVERLLMDEGYIENRQQVSGEDFVDPELM